MVRASAEGEVAPTPIRAGRQNVANTALLGKNPGVGPGHLPEGLGVGIEDVALGTLIT